jgi:hypothetical protein
VKQRGDDDEPRDAPLLYEASGREWHKEKGRYREWRAAARKRARAAATDWQWWTAIGTVAVAIVAVWQMRVSITNTESGAAATAKQLELATDANNIARKALESAQRSWLMPAFWGGRIDLVPNERVVVRPAVINTGRIPAVIEEAAIGWNRATDIPGDLPVENLPPIMTKFVIGPGQMHQMVIDFTPDEWVVDLVNEGRFILYVFGYVRYSDALGAGHGLIFCTSYDRFERGMTPCPRGQGTVIW